MLQIFGSLRRETVVSHVQRGHCSAVSAEFSYVKMLLIFAYPSFYPCCAPALIRHVQFQAERLGDNLARTETKK
jgi:hypothetical protein